MLNAHTVKFEINQCYWLPCDETPLKLVAMPSVMLIRGKDSRGKWRLVGLVPPATDRYLRVVMEAGYTIEHRSPNPDPESKWCEFAFRLDVDALDHISKKFNIGLPRAEKQYILREIDSARGEEELRPVLARACTP